MAELHLACGKCRRVVAVSYSEADVVQGRTDLADYQTCVRCGRKMVTTERGECAHVLLPGEDCSCRS
jgi:hypothetical protein